MCQAAPVSDPTPDQAIDRIRKAFNPPPGDRTLHAKGAFFGGSFTASAEAAARCRAVPFQGEEVPLLVRWSNGAGKRRADAVPDVRGMAVSFRPPAGGAMDLLGQTAPRFPVRTPAAFLDFTEAAVKPWKVGLFLARHPGSLPAMLVNVRAKAVLPPRSYAEIPYYPIHAYGWTSTAGDHCWVRFVLRPQRSERPEGSFTGPDRLREELVARLAAGPVRFTLEVTVAGPDDDPHDPMSVWKSKDTFDGGTITVTAPVEDPEAAGDVVVFDPTRVVDGIDLPDDPILRYRPGAYSASVDRRVSDSR